MVYLKIAFFIVTAFAFGLTGIEAYMRLSESNIFYAAIAASGLGYMAVDCLARVVDVIEKDRG